MRGSCKGGTQAERGWWREKGAAHERNRKISLILATSAVGVVARWRDPARIRSRFSFSFSPSLLITERKCMQAVTQLQTRSHSERQDVFFARKSSGSWQAQGICESGSSLSLSLSPPQTCLPCFPSQTHTDSALTSYARKFCGEKVLCRPSVAVLSSHLRSHGSFSAIDCPGTEVKHEHKQILIL